MNQDCLTLISALSQAAATLIAVFLAFLLSMLSDRNSWNQRKKEQIREHQIDSLKTIVSHMQKVDLKIDSIIKTKLNTQTKCANAFSNAVATNIKDEANTFIKQTVREIEQLKEEIWQEYWELLLLKYDSCISNQITDYIRILSSKIEIIESSISVVDDSAITDSLFRDLKTQFKNYIKDAENGLTK